MPPINLNIGESLVVGRLGNQAIKIQDMTVSRKHCQITRIGNNEFQIEDLDSSRGTFINNIPIFQASVKIDTPIKLGNLTTTVSQLLGVVQNTVGETVHIGHLERVFAEYEEANKELSKQRVRAHSRRSMPMQIGLPLIMGAGMFLDLMISDSEMASTIKIVLSVGCIGLSILLSLTALSSGDSIIDDQFEINKKFQIDYTCPKCKNFLGMGRPVEALLNTGKCPYCKSKFVR